MKLIYVLTLFFLLSSPLMAYSKDLRPLFKIKSPMASDLHMMKTSALKKGTKGVSELLEIMKSKSYSVKARWVATFMLGRITGKKASPLLRKYLYHPHWALRLASLKTLEALGVKTWSKDYAGMLSDKSLVIRHQALDLIRKFKIKNAAPHVWAMLYNKENYQAHQGQKEIKNLKLKRGDIIRKAIVTVGELQLKKAIGPLLSMAQKRKYNDIFPEINTSLKLLTQASPKSNKRHVQRIFWKKHQIDQLQID